MMNCIIPGLNIKVFAKALHALAKVGDNLFIEATDSNLLFVTLNLRKTVCLKCTFHDIFFSSFEIANRQNVACKIQMKTLIPLFKGTHLEKKFDFIKFQYEPEDDELILKMKYKCDDILMIHKLRLMEPELLKIQISSNEESNNLVGTNVFFNQLLNTFSNVDDEMTLEIFRQRMVARNYCVGAPVKPKSVRSHVTLNSSEFNSFHVEKETNINFSLKPLRIAIQFADSFNLNIALNIEKGGKPFAIIMKNPTFEVCFIVATLDPYSDQQNTMATSSIPAQITQINSQQVNLTVEDQQALMNVDWDDMNMETEHPTNSKEKKKKAGFKEIVAKTKQSSKKNNKRKENEPLNDLNGYDKNVADVDLIPESPESPKTKRAKMVFGRCFEATFSMTNLGEVLAPNSDSE